MFCGLGLKGQPDGYSVSNIFEGSFTEEGTVSGKSIFEGGFKFTASEVRKKFNITASADWGAIWEQSGSERQSNRRKFMRNKKYSNK